MKSRSPRHLSARRFPRSISLGRPLKRKVIKERGLFHGKTFANGSRPDRLSFSFSLSSRRCDLACCLIRYRCLRPPFVDKKRNRVKRNQKEVNTLRSDPDLTKIDTRAGEIIVKLNPKVIKLIYGT